MKSIVGAHAAIPLSLRPLADRPSTTAAMLRSIARVWRINSNRRAWRTLRYIGKCALSPAASVRWAVAVEHSALGDFLDERPRIQLKPHRAYLSRRYDFRRRAVALLNHYALAIGLRDAGKAMDLLLGPAQVLADIEGKNGADRYRLMIGSTDKFDREGEVMLSLQEAASGLVVQVLVFSLAVRDAIPCIEIGCLQGGSTEQSQALIKHATKALHGIRPKNLMLDAIYALSRCWNVQRIYGIGNESRVYGGRNVHSDYDAFWSEIGGRADVDGFYALPPALVRKTDIPSNRRAEYRRRAELRADMEARIQKWVGSSAVIHWIDERQIDPEFDVLLAEAA
jgi:uncharacterized protein VirK/YbjX